MNTNNLSAVILAAGKSSRLYPFDTIGGKSLITLCGKPLVVKTVEEFLSAGVSKIVIVEDENREISAYFEKAEIDANIKTAVEFVVQEKAAGMGDALLKAKDMVEDTFFVTSSYHFDIKNFIEAFTHAQKKTDDIVILTQEETDLGQFGAIHIQNGKVNISEKEAKTDSAQKVVSMYLLTRKFLDVLARTPMHHYNFEDAISSYTADVVLLDAHAKTLSLKYPWDLLSVKDYLLENIKSHVSEKASVSSHATISGVVYIAEGAKIMEGAVITGPAYIGKNAYIGTNVILRNGVIIEENAVVGAGMEIKNAILFQKTTTHSGFIGDSVIGPETKIAAGFITANVRLDRTEVHAKVKGENVNTHLKSLGVIVGPGCNMGIQVGTMPGVIIGSGVKIGPGTTVMENIESGSTFYTEFQKVIKKNDAE